MAISITRPGGGGGGPSGPVDWTTIQNKPSLVEADLTTSPGVTYYNLSPDGQVTLVSAGVEIFGVDNPLDLAMLIFQARSVQLTATSTAVMGTVSGPHVQVGETDVLLAGVLKWADPATGVSVPMALSIVLEEGESVPADTPPNTIVFVKSAA